MLRTVMIFAPHSQLLNLLPVCRLIAVRYEAEHSGVVCKLNDVIGWL